MFAASLFILENAMQTAAVVAISSMCRTRFPFENMRRTKFPFDNMRRTRFPWNKDLVDYKTVERMIKKAAHKFSISYGISFDEMNSEANFLYVRALNTYDPSQGTKFSTFLHVVLQNGLISYGQKEKKHTGFQKLSSYMDEDGTEHDPLDSVEDETAKREYVMSDLISDLSADEKQLVDLVLIGFASSIEALRRLATQRLGYTIERFNDAVVGIRQLLGEAA